MEEPSRDSLEAETLPPEPILPNGTVENRDDQGNLFQKITYNQGVLDGECITFRPDGKVTQKLIYAQGRLQGEALTYDAEGQIAQRLTYDQGLLHGMAQFFDKGILIAEISYQKGLRQGKAHFFAPNGRLQTEMIFEADKENGIRTVYDAASGAVLRTETFAKGLLEGNCISYYPSGAVMIQQSFQKGLLDGHEVYFYEDGTVQQVAHYEKGKLTEPIQKFDTKGREI